MGSYRQSRHNLAGFKAFVHPEGDLYWFDQPKRIITNLDPALSHWKLSVDAAYQQVVERRGTTGLPLSSELCLTSQQAGSSEVGYYLVDHDKKVIYWPEEVDVRLLDLGPFESNVDLCEALTSEYWVHVESFPSHRGVDRQAEESLVETLRHSCINDMTAPGSTSPWSAEECRQFLNILEGFRSIASGDVLAERMSCIARLSAEISRRHIHGYGTTNAQLDRSQGIEGYPSRQIARSLTVALGEVLVLGHLRRLLRRMTKLWNGRDQRHWKPFLDDMRKEWMHITYFTVAIWLAFIILLGSGKACTAVFVSAWLAAAAMLAALYLLQIHTEDRLPTAPGIIPLISRIEHFKDGLRPLSIMFALPRALVMYAFIAMQLGLVLVYRAHDERSRQIEKAVSLLHAFM
ncbi:hypothetical protein FRC04_003846 [Tulasnella sp. 424]|nr:hypothetical protein FRC04_003846 [Tulasnella sp. 424]KAG8975344.1 hypothetical protein FRC05_005903 [Tulasnella sp. 425]